MNLVIGITGGISSGKSTASNYIKDKGYKIIDADIISRQIMEYNKEGYIRVKKAFPEAFVGDVLDRKLLASIIFNDYHKREVLNNIMHPIIKEKIIEEINKSEGIVFLDVPLLFETHFDDLCDVTILISVDKETQIKRLMARDNIEREYAVKKIDSQMSLEEKAKKADYVIYNNQSIDILKNNIDEVLGVILNGKNLSNK